MAQAQRMAIQVKWGQIPTFDGETSIHRWRVEAEECYVVGMATAGLAPTDWWSTTNGGRQVTASFFSFVFGKLAQNVVLDLASFASNNPAFDAAVGVAGPSPAGSFRMVTYITAIGTRAGTIQGNANEQAALAAARLPVSYWLDALVECYAPATRLYLERRVEREWPGVARGLVYAEALEIVALGAQGPSDDMVFRAIKALLPPAYFDKVEWRSVTTLVSLITRLKQLDADVTSGRGENVSNQPFKVPSVGPATSSGNAISAMRTPNRGSRRGKALQRNPQGGNPSSFPGKCDFCNITGHKWKECRKLKRLQQDGSVSTSWKPQTNTSHGKVGWKSNRGFQSTQASSSSSDDKRVKARQVLSSMNVALPDGDDDLILNSMTHQVPTVSATTTTTITTTTGSGPRGVYVLAEISGKNVHLFFDNGAVGLNAISPRLVSKLGGKLYSYSTPSVVRFGKTGISSSPLGAVDLLVKFGNTSVVITFVVVEGLDHEILLGQLTQHALHMDILNTKDAVSFDHQLLPFVYNPVSFENLNLETKNIASLKHKEAQEALTTSLSSSETSVSFNPPPVVGASSNTLDPEVEWQRLMRLEGFIGDSNQKKLLAGLLMKYRSIFDVKLRQAGLADVEPVSINITQDATAKWIPQKRLSDVEWDVADKEIEALLKSGAIRPATESSTGRGWNSSITLAPKSDGTLRFCINYRALNAVTMKDKNPLPLADHLLNKVSGTRWLSKLDIVAAYHHVALVERDRHLTAFSNRTHRYEWKVIPFGFTNAPAYFQSRMWKLINGLEGVVVYMDDLVVYSDSFETHIQRLQALLKILAEKNFVLNVRKCRLCVKNIPFLGYFIDHRGVSPHPDAVRAIIEMPTPTSSSETKSLVGMIEYYSHSIKNCSTLLEPLRRVANGTFGWMEEQQAAFDKAKKALAALPVRYSFEADALTCIYTDASGVGLGASLVQFMDNIERPIMFWSRSLTAAEKNYSATKLELLAVREALRAFRPLIFGRHVDIYTDHQPLIGLVRTGGNESSTIITRWILDIASFDVTLRYRPGASNANADGLSRLPLIGSIRIEIPSWSKATKRDHYGCQLLKMFDSKPSSTLDFDVTSEGLIYFIGRGGYRRLYVPEVLREPLIMEHHNGDFGGHFGPDKTFAAIHRSFTWPTIKTDVTTLVQDCPTCVQKRKTREQHGLPANIPFGYPWQTVCVDMVGPLPTSEEGYKYILVAIDAFTHNIEVEAVVDATAETFIRFLVETVIARHGVPSFILSDNGRNFVATAVEKVYSSFGIVGKKSTPYNPQGNGLTERVIRTINFLLRLSCGGNLKANWPRKLPACIFAYRKTPHKATGFSPYFMEHGREPDLGLIAITDVDPTSFTDFDGYATQMTMAINAAHKLAAKAIERQQARRNAALLLKQPPTTFEPGDMVWLHKDQTEGTSKLYWAWKGPMEITQKYSAQVYKLFDPSTNETYDKINIRRLRLASQLTSLQENKSDPIAIQVVKPSRTTIAPETDNDIENNDFDLTIVSDPPVQAPPAPAAPQFGQPHPQQDTINDIEDWLNGRALTAWNSNRMFGMFEKAFRDRFHSNSFVDGLKPMFTTNNTVQERIDSLINAIRDAPVRVWR